MAIRILPSIGKLEFERYRLQSAGSGQHIVEKRPAHRTGRAGRTDQVTAAEGSVDHEILVATANFFDGVLYDLRARLFEQPGVEFEAPDGVLHARHRQLQTPQVPLQPP